MKTATKVVIAMVVALVVIGAAIGIVFAFVNSPTQKPKPATNTSSKPSSEKVAFISNKDIYSVDLDGTGQKQITDRGDIVDFDVSPNGSKIAFVAGQGDTSSISVMAPDGNNIVQVTKPENGKAENPAFDPTGKYLYFNLITPQDLSNIQANTPYSEEFERYDISAKTTDPLYSHGGMMDQSIAGLCADSDGNALYFNLDGSDWPSTTPYRLDLGTTVTESVYMPILRDSGVYTAAAFRLTSFSKKGDYISYIKDALVADPASGNDKQEEDACYRSATGTDEVSVASTQLQSSEDGKVEGIEFSRISNPAYYFGQVSNANADGTSVTLNFYRGDATSSVKPVQTSLGVMIQKDQGLDAVWHLLPVVNKKAGE
jgi:hypothetical protein